ncbi:hypothetical protein QMT40_003064 [Parvibaculaceae bacterium PLY_AMNH_Bact1]|nr:hypothetical protein QMT40_003064 [Parvibaculaceae bacterium PLY_AMNH_Bact1]
MEILRTKLGLAFCLVAATGAFLAITGIGGSPALGVWDNEARTNLPSWMMVWLGFLALTFLSSLIFAWNHVPARWVLAGFIGSHVVTIAIASIEGVVLRAGLVSLLHVIFWTPGLIALLSNQSDLCLNSVYGVWASMLLFVYAVAFTFDIRDGLVWILFMGGI